MKKIEKAELIKLIDDNSSEGVFIDFKQQWHEDNIALIHDILCLCNADYKGDRFLLFGVSDKTEIVGVLDKTGKKENDFIDLLRKSNFNRLPEIDLYTLFIDNKKIDVIHIADTPYKPYFLTKEKSKSGKTIKAGVVYSRNGSINTAIDSTASETEIDKMWRERFGIDQTPLERIKKYLSNDSSISTKWLNSNDYTDDTDYCDLFPEFTIRSLEEKFLDFDQEWTRGEIGYNYTPGNSSYAKGLFYYETCLKTIHCVVFDGGKKSIVAPNWEPVGKGRFYFYIKNSIEYSYQKYLSLMKEDYSKAINGISRKKTFDIPVFDNRSSLEDCLNYIKSELKISDSITEPERNIDEQNAIFYTLLDKYQEWSLSA